METVIARFGGLTKVTEDEEVHPFKSVTVTLYVPAPMFEILEAVLPPGVQK
jgi:hypothetical protein